MRRELADQRAGLGGFGRVPEFVEQALQMLRGVGILVQLLLAAGCGEQEFRT